MPKNLHDADNVLLAGIQRFFVENKLFDVKISWRNVVLFKCHKIVLASFSSYFETLLEGTNGCAILSLDAVKDVYVQSLQSIVQFMYGHSIVTKNRRECRQLLEAAKIFGVTALTKQLEMHMTKKSSVSMTTEDTEEITTFKSFAVGSLLLVNFQRYREDAKFIDAEISCQNRLLFSCHKLVLAAFSSYFESLLTNTEACAILNLDAVDSLYVDQLGNLLNFMYGRSMTACKDQAELDMLKDAAKVFGIHCIDRITTLTATATSPKKKRPSKIAKPSPSSTVKRSFDGNNSIDFAHEGNAAAEIVQQLESASSFTATVEKSIPVTPIAYESFKTSGDLLKQHVLQHEQHEQEQQQHVQFQCIVCYKMFTNEEQLMKHIETHLRNNTELVDNVTPQNDNLSTTGPQQNCADPSVTCDICSEKLIDRPALYSHYKIEHKLTIYACELCSKTFKSEPGLKQHREMHKSIVYKCDLCEFRTKTTTYLNLHMIKYHQTTLSGRSKRKNFVCSQCGLTFIFDSLLKRHYQSKHLKLKPFQCSYCDYAATEKGALKLHIRSAHTFIKPFACNLCNYRSTNSSALTKHKRRHTGEKPYQCDQCDAAFTEKRDLTVHKTKDHDRVRPFACTQCAFKFYRKDFLLAHMRTMHGVQKAASKNVPQQ